MFMKCTVGTQFKDMPYDMQCYSDAAGHIYDFGYSMNWSGVIHGARTARYTK